MVISSKTGFVLLILWALILVPKIWAQDNYRTNAAACGAIIHGPIINNTESDRHVEVQMGNEDNPIELTCQVNISNPKRHPAIALVIPEVRDLEHNGFKELRGGDINDDLYQTINYTAPELYPQTNNYTMRYSFQINPKSKMNRTTLRCGVALLQQNGRSCWGEQVVLVHYNGLSTTLPPPSCMCTTPGTSETTNTTDITNMPNETSDLYNTTVSVGSSKQNGIIAGAVLGPVIAIAVAVVAVTILLGVCKFWKKKHPHQVTPSPSPTPSPTPSTN